MKAIKRNATSQIAVIIGGQRSPIINPVNKREILSQKPDAERIQEAASNGQLALVRNINQHIAEYQIRDGAVFRSVKL